MKMNTYIQSQRIGIKFNQHFTFPDCKYNPMTITKKGIYTLEIQAQNGPNIQKRGSVHIKFEQHQTFTVD
jgi:hypothetical protein